MIGRALVLAQGLSLPAGAQGLSTKRLWSSAAIRRSPYGEVGQWVCPSYIRGLIDGARLQAIHTAGAESHRRIMQVCVPESASAADALAAVLRSEGSVYRLLKANDLITSPAYIVIKAADEFHDKTTAPNQLWQTDCTDLKVDSPPHLVEGTASSRKARRWRSSLISP
jgi:hypothetical protein